MNAFQKILDEHAQRLREEIAENLNRSLLFPNIGKKHDPMFGPTRFDLAKIVLDRFEDDLNDLLAKHSMISFTGDDSGAYAVAYGYERRLP